MCSCVSRFSFIDPIYHFANDISIDRVILEILKTPEFIRLKGIKQAGITGLFTVRTYDRAEHSFGVYLLLKYLGATLEQCIGGLLHDIYHTNFSHTTDELFCGENQESFHEKNKYIFFNKCCQNITDILHEYYPDKDIKYFLEGDNLLITKNKSFGADMLDYFLRDGYYEGVIEKEWINKIISKIKIENNQIVIEDIDLAKEFFKKTIYINDKFYMSPFSRGQYKIFMNILKLAIDNNIITVDEIVYGYSDDKDIYNKIKHNATSQMQELINLLETTKKYAFFNKSQQMKKTNTKVTRKLRFLNPLCLKMNERQPKRISDIAVDISAILKEKNKQYAHQEELYLRTSSTICSKI